MWQQRTSESTAPAAMVSTPARAAWQREEAVIIPFLQSVILAVVTGLTTSSVVGVLCLVGRLGPLEVVGFPAGVGVLVGLAVLTWQVWHGFRIREAVWLAERALGVDIDGDGQRGRPGERIIIVKATGGQAEVSDVDAARPAIADGRPDFYAFLVRLYQIGPARAAWLPKNRQRFALPSGRRVSRDTFDAYMAKLLEAGVLRKGGAGLETAVPIETAMASAGLVGVWTRDGRPAATCMIGPGPGPAGGRAGGREEVVRRPRGDQ